MVGATLATGAGGSGLADTEASSSSGAPPKDIAPEQV